VIGNPSYGTAQTAQPLISQPIQQVPTASPRQEIVYITINPSPGNSTPVKYTTEKRSHQVPETDVPIEHPIKENKVVQDDDTASLQVAKKPMYTGLKKLNKKIVRLVS